MKNTKHQTPNTNKLSNTNPQTAPLVDGWHYVTPPSASEPWMLKDETAQATAPRHEFDLEERTAVFGEQIVRFSKRIPRNPTNDRLINQIVGAGTSIGANFCEANDCVSKKDFRHTVKRCIKESKETRFFLRMIVASEPGLADEARRLYREATELTRILATMYRK
jgi:four helix bundle protein